MRVSAEQYYGDNANVYADPSAMDANLWAQITANSTTTGKGSGGAQAYAAAGLLSNGTGWCVDSVGYNNEIVWADMDAADTVCP
jgi:hypothetical protein